ncbi:hypothetical protein Pth03_74000 [Planotetraspora thailandica]|uniref:C4-dicarboxylate ABC transporter n=1 Tax=Planotetraspora thailandica TaxID=487172 RepID=A0A8J4DEN0_9ACTN|nr:hypothetical protein Pth03_74000 [Planotetraspora thailandica]
MVGEILWAIATIVWITTVTLYIIRAKSMRRIMADLTHPVLGPFAALIPISGILLGGHLFAMWPIVGTILVWAMFTVSIVFGTWFISQLLTVPKGFTAMHGGYLLPTVAAGLISAQSLATIGAHAAAVAAFGVGLLFWLLIGGALIARLVAGPEIPGGLLPSLAILAAPPAVAGNAWWGSSATFAMRVLTTNTSPWSTIAAWLIVGIATVVIGAIALQSIRLWVKNRSAIHVLTTTEG